VKIDNENSFSFSYSNSDKKKNYMINNKKTSSRNFFLNSYACVIFSPASMNMIYLSPNLSREFLDDTLNSSYLEYGSLLRDYKKVLKSRNSTLKAINE
jgi:recombinational DNA repair ATPase RecF